MNDKKARRNGVTNAATVFGIIAAVIAGVLAAFGAVQLNDSAPEKGSQERAGEARGFGTGETPNSFLVSIRKPIGPPRVLTGLVDAEGNAVTASCSSCHTTRPANVATKVPADLDEFHSGMPFSHGSISCLACHNQDDYDALRLADGTRLDFPDVMTLCAQCHGPQMTDYGHGAHGGMTGFWDKSRGPQEKLNCIDCHLPHTPQFPKMQPTFKPKDRFLSPEGGDH